LDEEKTNRKLDVLTGIDMAQNLEIISCVRFVLANKLSADIVGLCARVCVLCTLVYGMPFFSIVSSKKPIDWLNIFAENVNECVVNGCVLCARFYRCTCIFGRY
jgi:hypothetical protein